MPDRHPKDRYGLGWWITEDGSLEYRHDWSSKLLTPSGMLVDLWRKLEEIAAERDAYKGASQCSQDLIAERDKERAKVGEISDQALMFRNERDAALAEAAEYRALLTALRQGEPTYKVQKWYDNIDTALARHGAEEAEGVAEAKVPSRPALPPLPEPVEFSKAEKTSIAERYLRRTVNRLIEYLAARDGQEDADA